jgi:hypothetical protein
MVLNQLLGDVRLNLQKGMRFNLILDISHLVMLTQNAELHFLYNVVL